MMTRSLTTVLFGWYPYVCLTVFLLGSLLRRGGSGHFLVSGGYPALLGADTLEPLRVSLLVGDVALLLLLDRSGLPLAHWLTLTEGLIAARVAESLEEHGLTRVQWQLLNTLTVAPQSRAELEAGFEEEQRGAVSGQIEELVESRWVTVEGDLYTLTATGRTAGARVGEAVEALRAEATADVPRDQIDDAVRVLRRIARNLGHPDA